MPVLAPYARGFTRRIQLLLPLLEEDCPEVARPVAPFERHLLPSTLVRYRAGNTRSFKLLPYPSNLLASGAHCQSVLCSTAVSAAAAGRAFLASLHFVGLGREEHRPLSTLLLPG